MQKFQLNLIEYKWIPRIQEIVDTTRKVQSITVRSARANIFCALKKVVEKHGAHLRHLKIIESEFDGIHKLLEQMPLLESLEIANVSTDETTYTKNLPMSLKKLVISHCDVDDAFILQLLAAAPNVVSLELYDRNRRDLTHLILNLTSLKVLGISHNLRFEDITKVPFRLKKFAIESAHFVHKDFNEDVMNASSFKKFLKLQEDTLMEVSIKHHFTMECYRLVLSKLTNLTLLDINASDLPTEKTFYVCLSPLTSVKSLKVRGSFRTHEIGKLFFQYFPAIETLNLKEMDTKSWTSRFLSTIAKEQKQLKHLEIVSFYSGTRETLFFDNLKTLYVCSLFNVKLFINFVLMHRELESVVIGSNVTNGKLTTEILANLLDHPSLRHLKLSGPHDAMKAIFFMLKDEYKDLKTNTRKIQSVEFEFRPSAEKVKIKVYLPSSRSPWNPEQYEKLF